jgi:hypothetical protein
MILRFDIDPNKTFIQLRLPTVEPKMSPYTKRNCKLKKSKSAVRIARHYAEIDSQLTCHPTPVLHPAYNSCSLHSLDGHGEPMEECLQLYSDSRQLEHNRLLRKTNKGKDAAAMFNAQLDRVYRVVKARQKNRLATQSVLSFQNPFSGSAQEEGDTFNLNQYQRMMQLLTRELERQSQQIVELHTRLHWASSFIQHDNTVPEVQMIDSSW